jgi:hypothetical protein
LSAIVSQFTNPARAQKVAAIGQDSSKPFAPKPPLTMKTLRMLALIRVVDKLLAAAKPETCLIALSAHLACSNSGNVARDHCTCCAAVGLTALCHFAKS